MKRTQFFAALIATIAVCGCQKQATTPGPARLPATAENVAVSQTREDENAQRARSKWQGKTFEEFRASVYREPFEGGKYIVNGDVAVADDKQLREFFEQGIISSGNTEVGGRLIVMAGPNGTWNTERKHQLTYCVSNTFGDHKSKVVADIAAATHEWESVADVRYVHLNDQDSTCNASNDRVLFDVRPVNVNGTYLARAFFPNDSRPSRNVLIDNTSFQLDAGGNLQLVGILRHELGHTLGWRHEQTRPEAGTCFEDNNWVPMTAYDAFSVMHYPQCNGKGDWKLTLTDKDRSGAACVYGPANGFVVDPSLVQGRCFSPVETTGTPKPSKTESFTAQSLAKGQTKVYPAFAARAGSVVVVNLSSAAGAGSGDADLYVQLGEAPGLGSDDYVCRPFLSTSNETCEISTKAAPRDQVFVMVRGYTAAKFDLKVTYVPD